MNKIIYPADTDSFEKDYYSVINKIHEMQLNQILLKLPAPFGLVTFKDLLIASFEKILNYSHIFEKQLFPLLLPYEKNYFFEKFDYKGNQSNIAGFFMKYAVDMDMKTCHYCNIEFINTFQDLGEYNDILDFLNNGTEEELMNYTGIATGIKIFNYREINSINNINQLLSIKGVGPSTIININSLNLKIAKQKNHFTLDHFLPQGTFKYLSLCLYNLVPSCSSCNSKFKKTKHYEISDYVKFISPTSIHYNLIDHLEFKIYFNVSGPDLNEKINNVINLNDYIIQPEVSSLLDDRSKKFLDLFKIRGRYRFHKYQSFKMIKVRQAYSDSSIDEVSRITGISISEIKKDIFGSVIYSSTENNEPLAKYKIDIAKQIGIY